MWDERYAGEGFFYGTEPNDLLREHAAGIQAGGRVLCLAEGEGRNAVFLAGLGFSVVALDQSAVGLRKALQLAGARGASITTLHGQVVDGLKPGGVYLLEAYRPEQLQFGTGGPKAVDMLPTLAQLRDELSGLEFVHAAELARDVHEGQGHSGHSAVVQVLARKVR